MTTSEFIRRLKKQGIKFHSHATNHDWYINPQNGKMSQIPRHSQKELGKGLENEILKQLGLK